MLTTRSLLIFFLLSQANFMGAGNHSYALHVPKKNGSRCGAILAACIALPFSAFCFHRAMKTFDERKAITESIPGLEEHIKDLQQTCAEFNDPEDCDKYLAIHWTNLYDICVRRYDPALADTLLELRSREVRYMIPGLILAVVGITSAVIAASN